MRIPKTLRFYGPQRWHDNCFTGRMQSESTGGSSFQMRIGPDKEILAASGNVFDDLHREEAQGLIRDSQYLEAHLGQLGAIIGAGTPSFGVISEAGRCAGFQYRPATSSRPAETHIVSVGREMPLRQFVNKLNS
jgi:hypothetical protein